MSAAPQLRRALNTVLDWLVARRWIGQLVMGALWIYIAIAALGKGELFAVQVAFAGMLIWALTESDKCEYAKLLDQSLNLLQQAIDGWKADRK